jgi:predicted nucleic acid-binding protein
VTERQDRAVLDTSVLIDMSVLQQETLPAVSAMATVSLGELSAGLHTTNDTATRATRVERLQRLEATVDALPFDSAAARVYGRLVALTIAFGRNPRPRKLDLMIAATAAANQLPLYTRNPRDFEGLDTALTVVPV